jgi:xylulokinase
MPRFLTFDLGTTLYKVALFDDAGRLLALRRVTPPVLHPKPGWWELDPRTFQQPLVEAAQALREEVGGFDDVVAVSFATQANSFVLLDDRDEPLTPIILWPDQRAAELREELEAISKLPEFRERTGMPRFSAGLALAKVLRWKHINPDLLEQTKRFCYLSDLVTLWMTGEHATEGGVAGISGAMDVQAFAWWDEMLDRVGMRTAQMPRIVRAATDLGPIRDSIAGQLGVPASCGFVAGSLDQYAGAIGTGTVEQARVCETTGTVLAAVRCADRFEDRGEIFQGAAFREDRFFQMSFSSASANLLEWHRNSLPDRPSFEELTRLAQAASPSDLVIEPYDDRGPIEKCFRNLRPEHTVGQVVRAIMLSVAQALKRQIEQLCGSDRPSEIRSAGGAAKNDFWLQMKADVVGVPFVAMECEEPTSLGAAILAASGYGLGSVEELANRWARPRKRFEPRHNGVK